MLVEVIWILQQTPKKNLEELQPLGNCIYATLKEVHLLYQAYPTVMTTPLCMSRFFPKPMPLTCQPMVGGG